MSEGNDLSLKEFGRALIKSNDKIAGVKIVVFFEDGKLSEYSSKRDKELDKKYWKDVRD